jgi:hypothetical protein
MPLESVRAVSRERDAKGSRACAEAVVVRVHAGDTFKSLTRNRRWIGDARSV